MSIKSRFLPLKQGLAVSAACDFVLEMFAPCRCKEDFTESIDLGNRTPSGLC